MCLCCKKSESVEHLFNAFGFGESFQVDIHRFSCFHCANCLFLFDIRASVKELPAQIACSNCYKNTVREEGACTRFHDVVVSNHDAVASLRAHTAHCNMFHQFAACGPCTNEKNLNKNAYKSVIAHAETQVMNLQRAQLLVKRSTKHSDLRIVASVQGSDLRKRWVRLG